ncbi:Dipeptidyl-peptidase 5 [Cladobotryum mycophilum]|uniref:Dipeptidyl-peptidase V n=1 Tax=Cladobotryum mycophilum TaxID=491253 RepID=A0ABR0S868_9HYPO
MVHSQKLTAEALLGAPRRSPAVPNANGTLALYTVSTHDFKESKTLNELKIIDIETGFSKRITYDDKFHDALWIPGSNDEIIGLRSLESGHTQVVVSYTSTGRSYITAEIPAPVSTLKLKLLPDGDIAFVVAGLVGDDGSLFNDVADKPKSTGRVFDTSNVRVWNDLRKRQRYSLWYNKLELHRDGTWRFAGPLINLVPSPRLEAPIGVYDGTPSNNYDIGNEGIAFLAKDSSLWRPEQTLFSTPYYIRLNSFSHPPTEIPQMIERVTSEGSGISANIRISPDDKTIAFLYASEEDIQDVRLYTASVESLTAVDVFSLIMDTQSEEKFPPDGFEFAGSYDAMIIQITKHGRNALIYQRLYYGEKPLTFFNEGSVNAFFPLKQGKWGELLITSNSYIDSSLWQIVSASDAGFIDYDTTTVTTVSSATKHGLNFGLSSEMVTEFWYEGVDGLFIHSFMIRPSDFDETKKYPWVLMPHGGPISSWQDSWSTRWNMASWAEQGYVVICPNVSGSVGYGLDFAKRVEGQWGGKPYQDLLYLIEHLEQLPYLDRDKAVLAGASYGGYMVSWFLGHDVIDKFCCAVWHDGIFSIPGSSLQGDLIINNGEYGPSPYPWISDVEMDRWNPARPELLRKWKDAPPTLVIASEKDYRCPITEGLATFNTLQAQGVPSRFLTFSDEGHWVLNPENSLVWHQTVWDWVRRCVDGDIRRGDTEW